MIYLLNLIMSGSNPGILDLDALQKDLGFSSVAASGGTEKNSISKPDSVHRKGMPFYPQLRWRWAIRRVIGNIRRSKLQIALTRFRLLKGSSMEERLARVESALFKKVFKTHDEVNELAMAATRKAEEDTGRLLCQLEVLHKELAAHKEQSHSLNASNVSKIEEIRADCDRFDRTCADLDRSVMKLSLLRNVSSQKTPKLSDRSLNDSAEKRLDGKFKEEMAPSKSEERISSFTAKRVPGDHKSLRDIDDADEKGSSTGVLDVIIRTGDQSKSITSPEDERVLAHGNLEDNPTELEMRLIEVDEGAESSPYAQSTHRVDRDSLDRMDRELDSLNRRMNSLERGQAQVLQIKLVDLQKESLALQHNAVGYLERILIFKRTPNPFDTSSSRAPNLEELESQSNMKKAFMDLRDGVALRRHRVLMLLDVQRVLVGEISSSGAPRSTSEGANSESGLRSPRVFTSENAKQGALIQCDEILGMIRKASKSLADCETHLEGYSTVNEQPGPVIKPSSVIAVRTSGENGFPSIIPDMSQIQILGTTPPSTTTPTSSYSPSRSNGPLLDGHTILSTDTRRITDARASLSGLSGYSESPTIHEDIKSRMTPEQVRLISSEVIFVALTGALDPIRHRLTILENDAQAMKESASKAFEVPIGDKRSMRAVLANTNRSQPEPSRALPCLEVISNPNSSYMEGAGGHHVLNGGIEAQRLACVHDRMSRNFIDFKDPLEHGSHLTGVTVRSPRLSSNPRFNSSQRIEEGNAVDVVAGTYKSKAGAVLHVHHAPEGSQSLLAEGKPLKLDQSEGMSLVKIRSPYNPSEEDTRSESEDRALLKNNPEIMKLRDEINQMEIALKTLAREKINGYQAQQMIEKKTAQNLHVDDKVDNEAFAVVEVAVKHLASELDDLRHNHNDRLASVKKQFEDSFEVMTLNQTNSAQVDPRTYSSVITTGQCLGCGRLSAMNGVPIVANGQEIFRGGFRMPHSRMPGAPLGTVPLWATGVPDKEPSLPRPKTTAELSRSIDMGGGNQNLNEDSTILFFDSSIPQKRNIRPRTSSKLPEHLSLLCYPHAFAFLLSLASLRLVNANVTQLNTSQMLSFLFLSSILFYPLPLVFMQVVFTALVNARAIESGLTLG